MSEAAAFGILDAAWSIGVRIFDTAEAYGCSAARLQSWTDTRRNAHSIEIVTKCSVDDAGGPHAVRQSARKAVSRFRVSRLLLLTHGAASPDLWRTVATEAQKHHATAGQSVYSAEEVIGACALPGVERVQVPGNVLDQRAIAARGSATVPLDVRSIYLQGVLLDDPGKAEARAPGSGRIAAAVQSAAASLGVAVAPLLAASMLRVIGPNDRLVVGVDNVRELESLPLAFEIGDDVVSQFRNNVASIANDRMLDLVLDPRRWRAAARGC